MTDTAPPLRYAGVSRLTVAYEQAHLCEGLNEVVALTVNFFQFWWLTVIKWKFEPTVTIYAVMFWRSSWPYTSRISKYFQIQAMSSKVLLCLESVFLETQELIFSV